MQNQSYDPLIGIERNFEQIGSQLALFRDIEKSNCDCKFSFVEGTRVVAIDLCIRHRGAYRV